MGGPIAGSLPVRQRLRRLGPTLIAALVASLLAVPPAAAAPAPAQVPQLCWADCGDGLQCATAQVPLDYDKPRGVQISLALLRLPAGDPTHKLGSIFLNPGGPGGSGVDFVRGVGRLLFTDTVGRCARSRVVRWWWL